jgi:MFS family permease
MGLPMMTGFVQDDLRLSAATAGLLTSSYFLGKLLGSYGAGVAADRVGEIRVLVTGAVAVMIVLLCAAAAPFRVLVVLLCLAGVCSAGSVTAGGSLVRHYFPAHRRGLALSVRQSGIPLGGIVGAALLPWVAHAHGWRWSIAVAGVVAAAAAAPLLLLRDARRVEEAANVAATRGFLAAANRDVKLLTAWGCFAVTGQFTILVFLPLDLHARTGMSLAAGAALVAVAQLSGLIGRIVWGIVSDRALGRGRKQLLLTLTWSMVGAAMLLFAVPGSAPLGVWIAVAAIAGWSLNGFQGIWITMITEVAERGRVGAATGFAVTFTIAAVTVTPPLMGVIVDALGTYRVVWAMLAAILAASVVPALRLGADRTDAALTAT